ncbi:hypothetical protein NIES4073_21210 [Kalymmatonema gypsitolerans NIES-4073]|nr:hypothetical protein NIES4073_21210 [Scytonema sp. NIES-4073]
MHTGLTLVNYLCAFVLTICGFIFKAVAHENYFATVDEI